MTPRWRRYRLGLLSPIGPAMLTVALIIGAFNGMDTLDWALVTFLAFLLFLSSVLRRDA